MDRRRNYDVGFSGLKNGKHQFQFEIEQSFFTLFEAEPEFSETKVSVEVQLDKHSTFLEVWLHIAGTVVLNCDISGGEFEYPLENEIKVLVKFGEEYDDSDIEVVTIPAQDHAFNIAQLAYEAIMLAIPMKKISPDLSEEDRKLLERYEPKVNAEAEPEPDPRWEALQKLKNKN